MRGARSSGEGSASRPTKRSQKCPTRPRPKNSNDKREINEKRGKALAQRYEGAS